MNFENKKSLLLLGFEHTITKFCDETLNQLRYPASLLKDYNLNRNLNKFFK